MITISASCTNSTMSLSCLREAPATSLLAAATNIALANFMGLFTFVPVVDGTFIVERPTVTLKRGRVNGVRFSLIHSSCQLIVASQDVMLVTTNSDEGLIFTTPAVLIADNFTLTEYVTQLFPRLNNAQIQHAVSLYSTPSLATVPDQASAVMGDGDDVQAYPLLGQLTCCMLIFFSYFRLPCLCRSASVWQARTQSSCFQIL